MKEQQNTFFNYVSPSDKLIISPLRKIVRKGKILGLIKKNEMKLRKRLEEEDQNKNSKTDGRS